MDPNGAPFANPQMEQKRQQYARIDKELKELDRAISNAKRIAAETGRYADRKWFTATERKAEKLREQRAQLIVEMQANSAATRKRKENTQGRILAELCDAITRHFGKSVEYMLMSEVHAEMERKYGPTGLGQDDPQASVPDMLD